MDSNGAGIGLMLSKRCWAWIGAGMITLALVGASMVVFDYQDRGSLVIRRDAIKGVIIQAREEVVLARNDCMADRLDFPNHTLVNETCELFLRAEILKAEQIIALQQFKLKQLGQKPEPVRCIAKPPNSGVDMKLRGCVDT